MCSGTDPEFIYGWMCDECVAKLQTGEEFELCQECKDRADEILGDLDRE